MIRPVTIVTFLMACGSGLYLYQSKHQVQLLDRTIERTVHDTAATREQSRLLATEWNMLNDPERLRQFSDTYLHLRAIDPKQYSSLADLDSRLPAPENEVTSPDTAADPAAADAVSQNDPEPATVPVLEPEAAPVPPAHVSRPVLVARPVEPKVAEPKVAEPKVTEPKGPASRVASSRPAAAPPARPSAAEARQPESRLGESRVAESRTAESRTAESRTAESRTAESRAAESRSAEPRGAPRYTETHAEVRAPSPRPIILAAPRPQPVYTPANTQPPPPRPAVPAAPVQTPYTGSLLGMAHGPTPPAPRPTPVSASYNAN